MEYERKLLDMYVYAGEYRQNISSPFRQAGRICATDGHILIRIAEGLCKGEYTDTPNGLKAPNTASVMPQPNMCETVTEKMIERALEKAPEEKDRRCPECDGSGRVDYRYMDRHYDYHSMEGDCPECDGTGEASDYTAIKYQFVLHGNALHYHHLKVLLNTMLYLKTDSLRLRHIRKDEDDLSGILFDTEGRDVEILFVPMLRDDKLEEIKIKE